MRLTLMLCLALAVAGCARIADSRLNPLNWFGSSRPVANLDENGQVRPLVPAGSFTRVVDQRGLIAQVTAMEVARNPQGAIVRATGVASAQGGFNAQLVPVDVSGGVLTLAFRVERPAGFQPGGSVASRTISVARLIPADELAGIRAIRVQGAQNARVSSR